MASSSNSAAAVPTESGETFEQLYQQTVEKEGRFKSGAVVTGRVIKVLKDHAVVDVGFKSEGVIDLNEFRYRQKSDGLPNIGDEIDVYIESLENDEGVLQLSKDKADKLKVWDEIERIFEAGSTIDGRVVSKVKGGLAIDIGVKAFLPGSQIGLSPIKDLDVLLGKTYAFKIIKFNKKKGNIVLSRRVLLEKDRPGQSGTPVALEEGAIIDGIVKNITDYGAFVDLGGIDGLLHITDMSWGRISHPSELFTVGDPIRVKILTYDREKNRVSLGVKQISEDPWKRVGEKFSIGARVSGRVVSVTNYGAFVELHPGIEGLIHVSEMSWSKKVKHPNKIVQVGAQVEVVILDIDTANRRISLGLKQLEANPWELVETKYPLGSRIHGKVTNITDFGVFVGVEEGIDGLIHVSDISWSQKVRNPQELFKKGDEVEAVVLNVDPSNEKFSLGLKQLTADPWSDIEARYRRGERVSGVVVKLTDFGAFVELEKDVEGLVHVSEISRDKVAKPEDVLKVGQTIEAEVLNADENERRISLSMKSLEANRERTEMRSYLDSAGDIGISLGEMLEQKKK